jgi:hypothetical protein
LLFVGASDFERAPERFFASAFVAEPARFELAAFPFFAVDVFAFAVAPEAELFEDPADTSRLPDRELRAASASAFSALMAAARARALRDDFDTFAVSSRD